MYRLESSCGLKSITGAGAELAPLVSLPNMLSLTLSSMHRPSIFNLILNSTIGKKKISIIVQPSFGTLVDSQIRAVIWEYKEHKKIPHNYQKIKKNYNIKYLYVDVIVLFFLYKHYFLPNNHYWIFFKKIVWWMKSGSTIKCFFHIRSCSPRCKIWESSRKSPQSKPSSYSLVNSLSHEDVSKQLLKDVCAEILQGEI